MSAEPVRHTVDSRGLALNVWQWGEGPATILLHHGFLDHGRSWDMVAARLSQHYRVLANDARGHGDSGRIGAGGYYYFQDYTYDLSRIVDTLAQGPLVLVGHSMGGMVVSLFAGAFVDRAAAMISVEGYGPPDSEPGEAPERMKNWVRSVERKAKQGPRVMPSVEAAAGRLRGRNPRLTAELALHLAAHGTSPIDGGVRWKWDPLHMTRGPQPFYLAQAQSFWGRITCPSLLISGGESVFNYPDLALRECIAGAERAVIEESGHMVHYEAPAELAERIEQFLEKHLNA